MKAKLLFDKEITHPDLKSAEHLHAVIDKQRRGQLTKEAFRQATRVLAKAGHVIDHPEAWRLVEMGIAEPADQECVNAVDEAKLKKLHRLAAKAELLDVAQASGTPIDASDAAVAGFKTRRAEKRATLEVA